MFVCEIGKTSQPIDHEVLPELRHWLNPSFRDPGDLIFSERGHVDKPTDFTKNQVSHVWQIAELQELKKRMNATKKQLDPINKSEKLGQRYAKIANCPHSLLRGKHGLLCSEYNAEVVTNAWLKMFENMIFLRPLLDETLKKNRVFRSMHFAEAPGNFMLAINHYLAINYPKLKWQWLANSYRDLNSNNTGHYLGDDYGLMSAYPDNWIYGADGDGDITSPANVLSFRQEMLSKFGGREADFVTSDVKYLPRDVDYNEEENYNIPVHLGHVLCTFQTLRRGGIMMLKEFTFLESPSVCLLYLLWFCFDKLLVVKPETSRPANAEVYLFGLGYRANLGQLQMDRLLRVLGFIRYLNSEQGSPAIFERRDIPDPIVADVLDFSKFLIERQISSINKNLKTLEDTIRVRYSEICRVFRDRPVIAKKWIDRVGISPLPADRKLMVHEHQT